MDSHFYLPQFQETTQKIKSIPHARIGEIATFSHETTDFSEFPEGEFQYLEISGVSIGTNTYETTLTNVKDAPSRAKLKTKVGDIVLSTTRPHRGAAAQISDPTVIASTGFAVIREVDNSVDREWFFYTLLSNLVLRQLLQRSSGGNYPAILEEEIKKVYLPLVDEKKQLDMVRMLKRGLADFKEKRERAAELLAALENELMGFFKLGQTANKELCFSVRLGDLDGVIAVNRYRSLEKNIGHLHLKIADVCEIIEEKIKASNYGQEQIDWIRIDDLPNQPADIETVRTQPADQVDGSFFHVREGDILVARLGPTILNQKIVLVRHLERKTIASSEFLVLRCRDGFNPEVVMAVLKTPYYRDLLYSYARGSTPSRYRLNREDMLKLPFPDIRADQTAIFEKVTSVQARAKNLRAQAESDWKAAKETFERALLEG